MVDLAPWVIVALAAAVAVGLYLRARAAGDETASALADAEKLQGELASVREQLTKSAAKQSRAADDLQQLRKKLDKAKKRAGQASSGGAVAVASRVSELEAELEQARQARDAARDEAAALGSELSRLRAEAKPPPEKPAPPREDAVHEALRARADEAESELTAARQQITEHERSVEKLRAKLRTQELLYVAIRSELAAKKDRLRTQHEEIERLQALKVALVDAPVVAPSAPEDAKDEEASTSET